MGHLPETAAFSSPEVFACIPSQFSTSDEEGSDIKLRLLTVFFSLHAYPIIYPHGGYKSEAGLAVKVIAC